MGLTLPMDDFDDARFTRGPAPLGGRARRRALLREPQGRPGPANDGCRQDGSESQDPGERLRCTEDVLEELVDGGDGRSAVAVHGLTPAGRLQTRAEMQLLAALEEVAGLRTVPMILTVEDDGYVRESAPALRRRGGRRSAEAGPPATAEREAVAHVRDELDALIDEVHERGWVLGAAPGEGLGRRADGSVVLRDLRGLRPSEQLADRHADRAWVDSVLDDQERTLRRRVHACEQPLPDTDVTRARTGPRSGPDAADLAAVSVDPALSSGRFGPGEPARHDDRDRFGRESGDGGWGGDGDSGRYEEWAPRRGEDGDGPWEEPTTGRTGPRTAMARLRPLGPLPPHHPERRIRPGRLLGAGVRRRPGAGGPPEGSRAARAGRGLRRRAVLSAGAVVLAGVVIGTGSWLALAPDGTDAVTDRPAPHAPQPPSASAPAPPPVIEDPWALAAELAGSRHAYVTGLSSRSVAVPGSAASREDDDVRRAYESLTIDGGGPVIHEATLLEGPVEDGTAELLVITSTETYSVREAASGKEGAAETVPASAEVEIRLSLQWDGTRWLVASSVPVGEAAGGASSSLHQAVLGDEGAAR